MIFTILEWRVLIFRINRACWDSCPLPSSPSYMNSSLDAFTKRVCPYNPASLNIHFFWYSTAEKRYPPMCPLTVSQWLNNRFIRKKIKVLKKVLSTYGSTFCVLST